MQQPDGKIIVAGYISSTNGDSSSIQRLNGDGSTDASFAVGAGADSYVNALALQADGRLVIGGSFASVNSVARNRVARLNSNGSLDTSFNPGAVLNSIVSWVVVQPDGKVVTDGISNGAGTNLARFNTDGSSDASFNPGTGMNSGHDMVIGQPDGKLVVGGFFSSINGGQRNRVARLNVDGSLDDSFDPGLGTEGTVLAAATQPDGRIIIAASSGA